MSLDSVGSALLKLLAVPVISVLVLAAALTLWVSLAFLNLLYTLPDPPSRDT